MIGVGQGINTIFDFLVWPLAGVPALALVFLAILTAAAALLIFRFSTCKKSLSRARDRLVGHIYEMGLYQDHLSVLARIQGSLGRANLKYLVLTLPALLIMLLPMMVMVVQVESRFAHRLLAPGETTMFSVEVEREHAARLSDLVLEVPAGVVVVAGPVRHPDSGTVAWQLRVDDLETGSLRVLLDGRVQAARELRPVGRLPRLNQTSSSGFWSPLLAPGAPLLPSDSVLKAMTLQLPGLQTSYLGLRMNWLVAFCVFSLLGGLLLKDALKVSL